MSGIMKIAMLNTGRGWGGAEEQMLSITRELEHRGYSITVICRRGGPVEKRFTECGLQVLPVARKGLRAVVDPFLTALRARREKFPVIHSHRDHDLPLGKLLALASGGALLLTQHCLPGKPSALAYGTADRIITVSEYIASGIRSKVPGVGDRLGVIVNGIDPALFANPDREFWRRNPHLAGRGPLLGVVGGFYKGQEELIELLPDLRKEFPTITLILIGEDEGRKPQLQGLAERLGVAEAVAFAGRIPRDQIKHALAGLDLNVSAFRNEGFGLTVIEGFAVGTPFVGYRCGGYPEIVSDPRTGSLVRESSSLRDAIMAVLTAGTAASTDRYVACSAVAGRFTLAGMVDAYESLYRKLQRGK